MIPGSLFFVFILTRWRFFEFILTRWRYFCSVRVIVSVYTSSPK